jgi:hypothetical protein
LARCEQGYLCDVCGRDVENITESDLYLSYILGEIDGRALFTRRERHIRCNAVQAQFIVDERFAPVHVEGPFDKRRLDPASVRESEERVTRGYRRLHELAGLNLPIAEYPLPEVRTRHQKRP